MRLSGSAGNSLEPLPWMGGVLVGGGDLVGSTGGDLAGAADGLAGAADGAAAGAAAFLLPPNEGISAMAFPPPPLPPPVLPPNEGISAMAFPPPPLPLLPPNEGISAMGPLTPEGDLVPEAAAGLLGMLGGAGALPGGD